MYPYSCGKKSKNKLNGISESQSKKIQFEEYKKFSDGRERKVIFL